RSARPTTRAVRTASDAASSIVLATAGPAAVSSEEPNGAAVLVDVDVEGGGGGREAGHGLQVAAQGDQPPGARVGANGADRDDEAGRGAGQVRVVRERKVRLRHADR